jgi:hypothetical protein
MEGSAARHPDPAPPSWVMPGRPEQYDRRPLAPTERAALAVLIEGHAPMNSTPRRAAAAALARLLAPLHAVYALRHSQPSRQSLAAQLVCRQMHQRGRAFWQWSAADWQAIIGETYEAFERLHAVGGVRSGLRPYLLEVAYLLCGFDDLGPLWTATAFYPMACVVFGAARVDAQIARIDDALAQDGYATGHGSMKQRHQAIAVLLLLNRSPWLAQLSWTVVDRVADLAFPRTASIVRGKVAAALVTCGVLPPRSDPARQDHFPPGPREGVPDVWYTWYLAWRETGSCGLARHVARNYGTYVLYTGRWLAARHPAIVSPEQWTEETALALRTAVLQESNATFITAHGAEDLRRRRAL